MNAMQLRPVRQSDAQFLFTLMNTDAILEALHEIPSQLCDWQQAIGEWAADSDEENYIVCLDAMPVGWLGVNGLAAENGTVFLKMAAILPEYHGRGYGRRAIGQMIAALKQRGCAKLALFTDEENLRARACYSKCGFQTTQRLTQKMSDGKTVSRIRMELVL